MVFGTEKYPPVTCPPSPIPPILSKKPRQQSLAFRFHDAAGDEGFVVGVVQNAGAVDQAAAFGVIGAEDNML
jgi:hypothetical protein